LIEDEKDLAELIAFHQEREEFRRKTRGDRTSGLNQARSANPDLILLDLMPPGVMGTEL
jgi:two-component system, OmpR family, phosphate regulon response regulator PhoB